MHASPPPSESLHRLIADRAATIGVIGLGYVGLPLAAATARRGFRTVGFDIDATKVGEINAARSYIDAVSDEVLGELVAGRLRATADFGQLPSCDAIVICVPTPLTRHREPDLSYVQNTARTVAQHLRRGQLVVLESTTYPGTTTEVLKPILEATGLRSGADFFIGFSPEREDPGNTGFETATIPKVVAGDGPAAAMLMESLYGAIVKRIVPVSSTEVAEAVKITENVFRAVNIALVNELKVIYDAMGIDVWEVVEAASTKPFGFMPFYPGPGLGGHCVPIDPFYLTWKCREHELTTRFIELAGEINLSMPRYVVSKLEAALDQRFARSLGSARILILGLAYKKNVADIRESPALKLIELIERRGARVDFHDPHVRAIPATRAHPELEGRRSVNLAPGALDAYDAVLVVTDHDGVDYALVAAHARLLVDTRNVFRRKGIIADHIVMS